MEKLAPVRVNLIAGFVETTLSASLLGDEPKTAAIILTLTRPNLETLS